MSPEPDKRRSWSEIPLPRKADFIRLLAMEMDGGGWIDPDLFDDNEKEAWEQMEAIWAAIELLFDQTPGLRDEMRDTTVGMTTLSAHMDEAFSNEGTADVAPASKPRLTSVPTREEMWKATRKVYGDKIYNAMREASHGESPRIWESAALEAFTRGETGAHVETLRAGLRVLRDTGALE